ncbi:hypothetical protein ACNKHO_02570 [Shigella flexneri]
MRTAGLAGVGNGAAGGDGRGMSEGLTPLWASGNNLSVGQKQLLALARVLVDTRRC